MITILSVFLAFLNLFVLVFEFLIIIRVVISWLPRVVKSGFGRLIFDLTEPVLAPIRKLLPQSQVLDLSPIIAFFGLQLLQGMVYYLITHV
jgi:YggT family protein